MLNAQPKHKQQHSWFGFYFRLTIRIKCDSSRRRTEDMRNGMHCVEGGERKNERTNVFPAGFVASCDWLLVFFCVVVAFVSDSIAVVACRHCRQGMGERICMSWRQAENTTDLWVEWLEMKTSDNNRLEIYIIVRTICLSEMVESKTKCFVSRDYTEINFQNEFNEIVKYKSCHCVLPRCSNNESTCLLAAPRFEQRRQDTFITTCIRHIYSTAAWLNHK